MRSALVRYGSAFNASENFLQRLEEKLRAKELSYYASGLLGLGLKNESELEIALSKAMEVICSAKITCSNHFKKIYVSRSGQLHTDWLVSALGMRMIIMQASSHNPELAAMQVSILSSTYQRK